MSAVAKEAQRICKLLVQIHSFLREEKYRRSMGQEPFVQGIDFKEQYQSSVMLVGDRTG